jgi:hypothetical protein
MGFFNTGQWKIEHIYLDMIYFGKEKLIDWLFTVLRPAQEFFTYMEINVTIAGEVLQNLGLCSALMAFEQVLWHGISLFPVSSEGPPHLVPFPTHEGMWRIYSSSNPHRHFGTQIGNQVLVSVRHYTSEIYVNLVRLWQGFRLK